MQLASIKFVELPLDSNGARSDILGLEAHELAPSDSRETVQNDADELVVASREQRRAFSDKHDAECGRHRLLRSSAAGATITAATAAAARRRVGLADAAGILADAIEATAASHRPTCDLTNPASPSATVIILRENQASIEYLVLADSVLLLCRPGGGVDAITDDREAQTGRPYRVQMDATNNGSPEHDAAREAYLSALLAHRNVPGGFWIASADPQAAYEAIASSEPQSTVACAALLSDGASRLVDRFGLATWAEVASMVEREGPKSLIGSVREAERSDMQGIRWPRGKALDDATVAWCSF